MNECSTPLSMAVSRLDVAVTQLFVDALDGKFASDDHGDGDSGVDAAAKAALAASRRDRRVKVVNLQVSGCAPALLTMLNFNQ